MKQFMKTILVSISLLVSLFVTASLPQNIEIQLEQTESCPTGGVALYACENEIFRNASGEVDSLYFNYFGIFKAKMILDSDSVSIQIPLEWNIEKMDTSLSVTINRYDLAVATGEIKNTTAHRDMKWHIGTMPSPIEGAPRLNVTILPCGNVKNGGILYCFSML